MKIKSDALGFLKFKFSKKAIKVDEIFTVDFTVNILLIYVAFSGNVNFKLNP